MPGRICQRASCCNCDVHGWREVIPKFSLSGGFLRQNRPIIVSYITRQRRRERKLGKFIVLENVHFHISHTNMRKQQVTQVDGENRTYISFQFSVCRTWLNIRFVVVFLSTPTHFTRKRTNFSIKLNFSENGIKSTNWKFSNIRITLKVTVL